MTRPRVLVVDDKDTMVMLLSRILSPEFEVTTAGDGTRALGLLASQLFDVVISDIRMPGADGMTVLHEARRMQPETEVILMTAYATVEAAVEAMKQGAYDYLQKPFEPDEALLLARRAAERKQLRAQARDLEAALAGAHRFQNLIAESPPMHRVLELVRRAAASDATVLITGESGVGKEVVARAVHSASTRAQQRFIPINCGAMPEALFEAELFGYRRGAFTGAVNPHPGAIESAQHGTLFLDEIGEMPLAMQAKLLRVLETGEVQRVGATTRSVIDFRLVTATNRDLEQAVRDGRFRADLYYRVHVHPVHVPALRDRAEDVPRLVHHYLAVIAGRERRAVPRVTPAALDKLAEHAWPGNVRELINLVERAVLCAGPVIDAEHVFVRALAPPPRAAPPVPYREAKARFELDYYAQLMRIAGGNVSRAAKLGQKTRKEIYDALKRCGLPTARELKA